MRIIALLLLVLTSAMAGCTGPELLHSSVLGYDETIITLEREMLLINIARRHRNVPIHFTVTSSIAATFNYRKRAGFMGTLFEHTNFCPQSSMLIPCCPPPLVSSNRVTQGL